MERDGSERGRRLGGATQKRDAAENKKATSYPAHEKEERSEICAAAEEKN